MTRDLAGRTIIVTGASSGIGAAAARALSARGARVAIVGRTRERTAAVARDLGADYFLADFSRLEDVHTLATRLQQQYRWIDVLANNAGGIYPQKKTTVDGNDWTFQVNYLAPFLLTMLLLDRLLHAPRPRVVNTVSSAYSTAHLDLRTVNTPQQWTTPLGRYGASKLALVLFTGELARRTAGTGLTTAAFHPGLITFNLFDNFPYRISKVVRSPAMRWFMSSPETGAAPLVHLATDAIGYQMNGRYFRRYTMEIPRNRQAFDLALSHALWTMSEDLVGDYIRV